MRAMRIILCIAQMPVLNLNRLLKSILTPLYGTGKWYVYRFTPVQPKPLIISMKNVLNIIGVGFLGGFFRKGDDSRVT